MAYTSYNMVASMLEGTTGNCWTYDDRHARVKLEVRASSCTGTLSSTTTYLNDPATGAMSEKLGSDWHDFLKVDGAIVAERFCTGSAPCTSGATMRYFTLDSLNSVVGVTSDTGTILEQHAYDPWGRERNLNGTDASTCPPAASLTSRGFTGHEMLSPFCEINANARIYDPTLGRFLAADTVVPDPFNAQSLNRYSYLENNPLSGTDPTGHFAPGDPAGGASYFGADWGGTPSFGLVPAGFGILAGLGRGVEIGSSNNFSGVLTNNAEIAYGQAMAQNIGMQPGWCERQCEPVFYPDGWAWARGTWDQGPPEKVTVTEGPIQNFGGHDQILEPSRVITGPYGQLVGMGCVNCGPIPILALPGQRYTVELRDLTGAELGAPEIDDNAPPQRIFRTPRAARRLGGAGQEENGIIGFDRTTGFSVSLTEVGTSPVLPNEILSYGGVNAYTFSLGPFDEIKSSSLLNFNFTDSTVTDGALPMGVYVWSNSPGLRY